METQRPFYLDRQKKRTTEGVESFINASAGALKRPQQHDSIATFSPTPTPAPEGIDSTPTVVASPPHALAASKASPGEMDEDDVLTPLPSPMSSMSAKKGEDSVDTDPVRCDCGVQRDDTESIYCDGCGRWHHLWCADVFLPVLRPAPEADLLGAM